MFGFAGQMERGNVWVGGNTKPVARAHCGAAVDAKPVLTGTASPLSSPRSAALSLCCATRGSDAFHYTRLDSARARGVG